MRIIELPSEFSADYAIAVLAQRLTGLTSGAQIWLGNGVVSNKAVVSATLHLNRTVDDTLSIYLNGVPIRDLSIPADAVVDYDLVDLATTAGLVISLGDRIELFAKDTIGVSHATASWTAAITFDDGSEQVITGGVDLVTPSTTTQLYFEMGLFYVGRMPSPVATSYRFLAPLAHFALHGALAGLVQSDSFTVGGQKVLVQLDGPDLEIAEQDLFNALNDELLLFINDEILSVAGYVLRASGLYEIDVIRGRFATLKQSHAVGDEVFILHRVNVAPIVHPQVRPGNELALKLTYTDGALTDDLSDVDASSHQLTGNHFAPAPRNIRIGGQQRNCKYSAGSTCLIEWSLPNAIDASGTGRYRYLTQVKILSATNAILGSFDSYGASLKISASKMAAILGAEAVVTVALATVAESEELTLQSPTVTTTLNVV